MNVYIFVLFVLKYKLKKSFFNVCLRIYQHKHQQQKAFTLPSPIRKRPV